MSWNPALDRSIPMGNEVDAIEAVIVARARDLGGFEVRRALPSVQRQMVGPFIFFDQMGPAEFLTGQGVDVRPHPHIGLATVTYLLKGAMHHRDSLGTDAWITPGEVNLMTAGHGITHSERSDGAALRGPTSMFGLQTWLALPRAQEDAPAAFYIAPAMTSACRPGLWGRV
jgi:redox-sensitive bicupin YhaK (pirin superfamily)